MDSKVLTAAVEQGGEARLRALEEEVRLLRVAAAEAPQLKAILDHSPQGILIHRGASPLYVNPAFIQIMGLPGREAAMALPAVTELIHPGDRAFVTGQIEARNLGDEFQPYYEFRARHGSGSFIWLDCHASRIEWNGRAASLVSVSDITIRKRIEDSLRRSEK